LQRLLNNDVAKQVQQVFENLGADVAVIAFGRQDDQHSEISEQLMEEVVELSDKLSLQKYDFDADQEIAAQYNVTEAPAFVIAAKDGDAVKDMGIRILGTPSGHEFTSLIHSLITVSQRQPPLSQETMSYLNGLTEPIRLQIFSTPT